MIKFGYGIACALVLLGMGLLLVAVRMPRFKNMAEFQECHDRLGLHFEDDATFAELLVESQTSRNAFENYGMTLMICGLVIAGVFVWHFHRCPLFATQGHLVSCGVVASMGTVLAEAAKVFLASARQEFPWWHSSIVLRISPLPVGFVMLLGWVVAHSFFAGGTTGRSRGPGFRLGRVWLVLLRAIAALLVSWSLATGDFFMLASRGLWLVFYHAALRSHMKTGRMLYF